MLFKNWIKLDNVEKIIRNLKNRNIGICLDIMKTCQIDRKDEMNV